MKFTPPDERLLTIGTDGKEHATVRRLLFLAGAVLGHAPDCPSCGSGEDPYRSARPGGASAVRTTTATVPGRARLRPLSPEAGA